MYIHLGTTHYIIIGLIVFLFLFLIYWALNKHYQCKMVNISAVMLILKSNYNLSESEMLFLMEHNLMIHGLKPSPQNADYIAGELIRLSGITKICTKLIYDKRQDVGRK